MVKGKIYEKLKDRHRYLVRKLNSCLPHKRKKLEAKIKAHKYLEKNFFQRKEDRLRFDNDMEKLAAPTIDQRNYTAELIYFSLLAHSENSNNHGRVEAYKRGERARALLHNQDLNQEGLDAMGRLALSLLEPIDKFSHKKCITTHKEKFENLIQNPDQSVGVGANITYEVMRKNLHGISSSGFATAQILPHYWEDYDETLFDRTLAQVIQVGTNQPCEYIIFESMRELRLKDFARRIIRGILWRMKKANDHCSAYERFTTHDILLNAEYEVHIQRSKLKTCANEQTLLTSFQNVKDIVTEFLSNEIPKDVMLLMDLLDRSSDFEFSLRVTMVFNHSILWSSWDAVKNILFLPTVARTFANPERIRMKNAHGRIGHEMLDTWTSRIPAGSIFDSVFNAQNKIHVEGYEDGLMGILLYMRDFLVHAYTHVSRNSPTGAECCLVIAERQLFVLIPQFLAFLVYWISSLNDVKGFCELGKE